MKESLRNRFNGFLTEIQEKPLKRFSSRFGETRTGLKPGENENFWCRAIQEEKPMSDANTLESSWRLLACIALMCGSLIAAAGLQSQEDEVRDIGRSSWGKNRAASTTASRRSRQKPSKDVDTRYRIRNKLPEGAGTLAEDSEIGVTLWQLRPARTDDAVEIRDLVQPPGGGAAENWTPERVESDTEFAEGQMVRLMIESLRTGFLYVINRAKYKDGTYGDPYLIFPTKRIYDGNNAVRAAEPIQIPGPAEQPFVLKRRESRRSELSESEEIILLITPQPLQSFPMAPPDRQKLTPASVEGFIERYSAAFEVSEKIGGAGQAITLAEKMAAKRGGQALDEDDPYPQTIYRIATKPGDPMLVVFQLKVRGKQGQ